MNDNITWEQSVLWLRAQPDQQELVRACYYDDPLLESAQRYEASEEWRAALSLLPQPAGDALDLGAGRGIGGYALAKAGWRVDALEPDASSIVGRGAIEQLAKESGLPIAPIDGFAEQIPSPDAQYDLVYGRQVMHHARDLKKMCAEVGRVLKPGGVFIAAREHVIGKEEDLSVFLANHPLHFLYSGESAFLLQDYLDAIGSAGLRVWNVFGAFDSPINYFPMTYQEWRVAIQNPIAKRISGRLTNLLLNASFPWSEAVNHGLAMIASRLDQTPGRLYTFVACKPLERLI